MSFFNPKSTKVAFFQHNRSKKTPFFQNLVHFFTKNAHRNNLGSLRNSCSALCLFFLIFVNKFHYFNTLRIQCICLLKNTALFQLKKLCFFLNLCVFCTVFCALLKLFRIKKAPKQVYRGSYLYFWSLSKCILLTLDPNGLVGRT